MAIKESSIYEQEYTPEERRLAEYIIGLEKSVLDRYGSEATLQVMGNYCQNAALPISMES